MSEGETVRVITNGKTGTVEQVRDDNRVLVAHPVTLRNGQPGRVLIEYLRSNLEVVNG